MAVPKHPESFLEIRVDVVNINPGLTAACAGYEAGEWRCDQLAKHITRWLPEFALKYSEWKDLTSDNAVMLLAKAAQSIYKSEKYQKRGEFGEILLHILLRQCFKTIPAISKYFYKDSSNDTIKGFDAVHVVASNSIWELWLGEVKFYSDISAAIRDVVEELQAHTKRDYLRGEFTAITNKIDDEWADAAKLRKMLNENVSLDVIFASVCIPVLLTYDSSAVASHTSVCAEYEEAFRTEVMNHHSSFAAKALPTNVKIHLFLLPLKSKSTLVERMDARLKNLQSSI